MAKTDRIILMARIRGCSDLAVLALIVVFPWHLAVLTILFTRSLSFVVYFWVLLFDYLELAACKRTSLFGTHQLYPLVLLLE